jgi:hypothetical protein
LALLILVAWMETTDGETRSKSTASGSAQGWAATVAGSSVMNNTHHVSLAIAASPRPSRARP